MKEGQIGERTGWRGVGRGRREAKSLPAWKFRMFQFYLLGPPHVDPMGVFEMGDPFAEFHPLARSFPIS